MLLKLFHIIAFSRNARNQSDLVLCSVDYKALRVMCSADSA